MKILIVPDIHARDFWKEPVAKYLDKVEKIVFLGDYCDPYMDEGEKPTWKETIENFKEIIELKKANPEKVVLLLGNHCMHYRNKEFGELARSTRFDSFHAIDLRELYTGENYNLFQLCYTVKLGEKFYIFTHAGITEFWLNLCGIKFNPETIEQDINDLENSSDGIKKLAVIGQYRTWIGEKTGSPLWCDLREFISNDSLGENTYQIFGHSRLKQGAQITNSKFSCLDSREVFMLDDKLKIKKVKIKNKES